MDGSSLDAQSLVCNSWVGDLVLAVHRSLHTLSLRINVKLEGQSGVRTRDHRLSKQAALTIAPGTPPMHL